MIHVTYKDLVMRFGDSTAQQLMRTVERLAQLQNNVVTPIDREERFRQALEALNHVHCA
jgi:cell fate (sporulation/competence/biofilm development) regulator YlbF (YheA/YmcA/DUF963 family)